MEELKQPEPIPDPSILDYERSILSDLNSASNCLLILGKGFSLTKTVASFLYQYKSEPGSLTTPYLMFLINFSDQQFKSLEYYLETLGPDTTLPLLKFATNDNLSNKRVDLYLKGGVFSISYKCLVLDLLTKRLSPSIITGFIINSA